MRLCEDFWKMAADGFYQNLSNYDHYQTSLCVPYCLSSTELIASWASSQCYPIPPYRYCYTCIVSVVSYSTFPLPNWNSDKDTLAGSPAKLTKLAKDPRRPRITNGRATPPSKAPGQVTCVHSKSVPKKT